MRIRLITLFLILTNVGLAQFDSVAYSRDYEFKEGIYLTIQAFKQNRPIPSAAIISPIPKTELTFLTDVVENKTVRFIDEQKMEQEVQTETIWGYCRNRTIYINFNKSFNRINVIGSICHFTANVRVVAFQDPMYYNRGLNSSYTELRQYILNTQTNIISEFNVQSMENILQNDPELYAEFTHLKKRKKADSIFIYLRKYNERHPLKLYNGK